eukprot:gene5102-5610_t
MAYIRTGLTRIVSILSKRKREANELSSAELKDLINEEAVFSSIRRQKPFPDGFVSLHSSTIQRLKAKGLKELEKVEEERRKMDEALALVLNSHNV